MYAKFISEKNWVEGKKTSRGLGEGDKKPLDGKISDVSEAAKTGRNGEFVGCGNYRLKGVLHSIKRGVRTRQRAIGSGSRGMNLRV